MSKQPLFQMYECENENCRLRFPSDLSIQTFEKCPFCGYSMRSVNSPFSNYSSNLQQKELKIHDVSLVLDNLRSTLNVGSIFRTSDGAGVKHIYCCGTTPTPDHPKIGKTSLGAESFIPWSYHKNSIDLIRSFHPEEITLISFESTQNSRSIFDIPEQKLPKNSILVVVGNEISGIDPEILDLSDFVLDIPMLGNKQSLNVAVAAGICLYMLQYLKKGIK
jgi:23S rRNA (guanosine2251-2'-O)-methyltransferase